nr:HTH domain-containing protein [uncultured Acetatifactor sp.]
MGKKVFTNEEMEMLRSNPYTYSVTPSTLYFTKEFKELFWQEYQKGEIPRQILSKYGYPADVLGKKRIWGIAHNIKDQYYSKEGLREGFLKRETSASNSNEITEEAVRQLQEEVQQLRQEIELMKKGFSTK